jgi:hypothetical protein
MLTFGGRRDSRPLSLLIIDPEDFQKAKLLKNIVILYKWAREIGTVTDRPLSDARFHSTVSWNPEIPGEFRVTNHIERVFEVYTIGLDGRPTVISIPLDEKEGMAPELIDALLKTDRSKGDDLSQWQLSLLMSAMVSVFNQKNGR